MKNFFIAGLPRSRTTWFANYFTTDRSICYHDGKLLLGENYVKELKEDEEGILYKGDSSFSIPILDTLSSFPDSPVLVVDRDTEPIKDFFVKVFKGYIDEGTVGQVLGTFREYLNSIKNKQNVYYVKYENINKEIEEIHKFLTPDLPYSPIRAALTTSWNVQEEEFDKLLACIRLIESS